MAEITEEMLKEALEKQKQELQAEFEKQTEGLRSNRDSLLAEKKQIEEDIKVQILEKEKEAIEAAKASGDLVKQHELEAAKSKREAEALAAENKMLKDVSLSSEKKASVNSMVSHFAKQDRLSQITAAQLVDHSFSEDGSVIASYKDLSGNVIADNHDDWLDWAKSDPDMQNHLAGSKASGTDYSTVSPSSTNQDKNDYSKMSNDDKLSYLENVQLK